MRRLFWLSVGAGAGVYATRRVNRFTRQWAPENVAARTGERLMLFARDVREQTRARETQLREALELDGMGGTGVTQASAAPRRAIAAGAAQLRRALPPARPPQRPALGEAAEGPPPGRILKGQYTIINDDKDGH